MIESACSCKRMHAHTASLTYTHKHADTDAQVHACLNITHTHTHAQAAHVVVPVKETLVGLGDLKSTNVGFDQDLHNKIAASCAQRILIVS